MKLFSTTISLVVMMALVLPAFGNRRELQTRLKIQHRGSHKEMKQRRGRTLKSDKGSKGETFKIEAYASGRQEVPPVITNTEAEIELQFAENFSFVNYKVEVQNGVGVTLAHLHCGLAGANGGIIVLLFQSTGTNVNGQLAAGTITDITFGTCGTVTINNVASLYEAILQRQVYLNVHTLANPNGEVRGQIFPYMYY